MIRKEEDALYLERPWGLYVRLCNGQLYSFRGRTPEEVQQRVDEMNSLLKHLGQDK